MSQNAADLEIYFGIPRNQQNWRMMINSLKKTCDDWIEEIGLDKIDVEIYIYKNHFHPIEVQWGVVSACLLL